jgi:hypothetical protein
VVFEHGGEKKATCPYCGESGHTRGVTDARELYAQAWCDATGATLQAIEFTPEFLRERVTGLLEACEQAEYWLAEYEKRPFDTCVATEMRRVLNAAIAKAKARGG